MKVLPFLLLLAAQTADGGCDVDELPDTPDHADREGGPVSGDADVGTKVTYKCNTGYEFTGDPVPHVTERPTTTTTAAPLIRELNIEQIYKTLNIFLFTISP